MSLEGIIKGLYKAGEGGYKIGSKIANKAVEKVAFKDAKTTWQKLTGLKFTNAGKALIGVGTGVSAVASITDALDSSEHIAKNGTMQAAELANTVGSSRTPGLAATVSKMDRSPDFQEDFIKHNVNRSQDGVDANIVFAMHQLRNG